MRTIEVRAICDRRDCGVTVIHSRLGSDKTRFYSKTASIELNRPARDKPFELSITELELADVSGAQLQKGFFRRA